MCILFSVGIISFAFAGCGENSPASDMSDMASDAVSGAESMMDNMTGGEVTDKDGVIGNETTNNNSDNNNTNNTQDKTASDTDNTMDRTSGTTATDNNTENNTGSRNRAGEFSENSSRPDDMLL